MRLFRFLTLLGAVCAAAMPMAQMGRWQLGNPSLIIDLPGDPGGGGVSWHTSAAFLPTSWSSENDDLRVEVSEQYGSVSLDDIKGKIGGDVSTSPAFAISGYPAVPFKIGNKAGVRIQATGQTWFVLVAAKTSAGVQLAQRVMNSIAVERSGEKRWVQRSLGNTRMNAELPFELAFDPFDNEARRTKYELHFDDFAVTASVSSPEEGFNIDYEKTIKSTIEDEKNREGTKDFKSKREKIKRDQLEGDLLTLEFTRGRAYKSSIFFAKDSRQLLRLNMNSRGDRPEHEAYVSRVMDSLRVSSVVFTGFEPRQVGDEGIWFDLPKAIEKLDATNYNSFFGAFQINVRVTPVDPGTASNPDQLLDFLEVKFKNAKDARDYKSERSETTINGMEARILKTGYKGKGRSDQTVQYALAIFLPDRIVVAEMISEEQQKAYLERIIDTARIELKPPSGWTRQMAGESGLSVLAPTLKPERIKSKNPNEGDKIEIIFSGEGLIGMVVEMPYISTPPTPGLLARELFEVVKKSMNATGKIVSQQPIEIGNHSGIRATAEWELSQGKVVGDIIVLRRGKTIWALVIGASPQNGPAMIKRAVLVNSIQ